VIKDGVHENVCAAVKSARWPIRPREFVAVQLCATDVNGDLLFAAQPTDDQVDYGANFKAVRGSVQLFSRFVAVSRDQCEMHVFQRVDPGGNIPIRILNARVAEALGAVDECRVMFDRSEEIDEQNLRRFADVIESEPQVRSTQLSPELRQPHSSTLFRSTPFFRSHTGLRRGGE
jgi:hypothetical protein